MNITIPLKVVLTTFSTQTDAEFVANNIINEKLAACANIIPNIKSIYYWNGKLVDDTEVILLIKTNSEKIESLIHRIMELHNYDLPEILTLDAMGDNDYSNWIMNYLS